MLLDASGKSDVSRRRLLYGAGIFALVFAIAIFDPPLVASATGAISRQAAMNSWIA